MWYGKHPHESWACFSGNTEIIVCLLNKPLTALVTHLVQPEDINPIQLSNESECKNCLANLYLVARTPNTPSQLLRARVVLGRHSEY